MNMLRADWIEATQQLVCPPKVKFRHSSRSLRWNAWRGGDGGRSAHAVTQFNTCSQSQLNRRRVNKGVRMNGPSGRSRMKHHAACQRWCWLPLRVCLWICRAHASDMLWIGCIPCKCSKVPLASFGGARLHLFDVPFLFFFVLFCIWLRPILVMFVLPDFGITHDKLVFSTTKYW